MPQVQYPPGDLYATALSTIVICGTLFVVGAILFGNYVIAAGLTVVTVAATLVVVRLFRKNRWRSRGTIVAPKSAHIGKTPSF